MKSSDVFLLASAIMSTSSYIFPSVFGSVFVVVLVWERLGEESK